MSIYYKIPRNKIHKYLIYKKKSDIINNTKIFNNDIDLIISEYITGDFKIIKIKNYYYPIFKDIFNNIEKFFLLNNRIINLNYNENFNKNITDFIIFLNLFYSNIFILHLYDLYDINDNFCYSYFSYKNDYIDKFLLNINLNDFHHFIRISNKLYRNDFNVLYHIILENSFFLSPKTVLKSIKL